MTKQEKAFEYLNKFRNCKLSSLKDTFSSVDSGMNFILFYMYTYVKEVTAKELAEQMNVSKARITSLIQKLEERGLVQRKTSYEDERVNIISLTEKGNEEGEELINYSLKVIMQIMDEIGLEEIDRFLETLFKVKEILMNITTCGKN